MIAPTALKCPQALRGSWLRSAASPSAALPLYSRSSIVGSQFARSSFCTSGATNFHEPARKQFFMRIEKKAVARSLFRPAAKVLGKSASFAAPNWATIAELPGESRSSLNARKQEAAPSFRAAEVPPSNATA
jgi:hypothetical protein